LACVCDSYGYSEKERVFAKRSNTLDGERERSFPIIGTVRKSSTLDGEREHSFPVFGILECQ